MQNDFNLTAQPVITCSKLAIKTPERRHWRSSGVSIVNFGNFEEVNAGWEKTAVNIFTV